MWASEDYQRNLSYDVVLFARSIVLGYHCITKINWRSFQGRREEKWGSFRGRFGIISELGIISGSGSSRGLYSLSSGLAES